MQTRTLLALIDPLQTVFPDWVSAGQDNCPADNFFSARQFFLATIWQSLWWISGNLRGVDHCRAAAIDFDLCSKSGFRVAVS